ncbi:MAG: isochorismatase family protein, partial [Proteobacteria bacterium]|nr:isochorismatase family protein [Pseudomonadota bacterium]
PKTALIVIDLPQGIASMTAPEALAPIVERSRALADAFRARGLPVVLVNAAGVAPGRTEHGGFRGAFPPGFDELLDGLGAQSSDIRVTKRTWGAFRDTDLEEQLKGLGVTQVVVTGVATSIGVESTARQAYEAGFNVTLAVDAMADLRPEAHENSIALVFPRLGETGSTEDVLALLA